MNTSALKKIEFDIKLENLDQGTASQEVFSARDERFDALLKIIAPKDEDGNVKSDGKKQIEFVLPKIPEMIDETKLEGNFEKCLVVLVACNEDGDERTILGNCRSVNKDDDKTDDVDCSVDESDDDEHPLTLKFVQEASLDSSFKNFNVSLWIPSEFFADKPTDESSKLTTFEKTPIEEILLADNLATDFSLVSKKDGKVVQCHRCLLYVSGEYFQKLIDDNLDPGNTRVKANLPFSEKTLEHIKKYVYTRTVVFSPEDDVSEVVDAGSMMMFPGLVQQCEEYLMRELENKDKLEMLALARKFGLDKLKAKIFPVVAGDPEFRKKVAENDDYGLLHEYTTYLMENQKF